MNRLVQCRMDRAAHQVQAWEGADAHNLGRHLSLSLSTCACPFEGLCPFITRIAADLEPSADLTGGNWYANGELDLALVEACKHTATRFLMEKRREKEGATIKEVLSASLYTGRSISLQRAHFIPGAP